MMELKCGVAPCLMPENLPEGYNIFTCCAVCPNNNKCGDQACIAYLNKKSKNDSCTARKTLTEEQIVALEMLSNK